MGQWQYWGGIDRREIKKVLWDELGIVGSV